MTTYYYPSNYGAGEAAASVSSAGTQNFSGTEQEPAGSYSAITPLGNTGPNGELQYSVTFDYTGPGTGTTITTTQTAYSDANHSESFGQFPVVNPDGTTTLYPTYFIATNGPVTVPYNYSFGSAGSPTTTQFVASPSVSTTDPTVCFASGTLIATADGQIAVEALSIGHLARTSSNQLRRIVWLGHRTIACRNHPRPDEVMPIRISAHALGENRPLRDLFVSPGHSICVDVLGEVLIPAGLLVNGSTIQQVMVDEVTYWHVELESHDIILAENLPTESYLEMDNRGFFKEVDVIDLAASPDPARRTHADFCRPFVDGGPILDAVRMLLRQRAEALGWWSTDALDMHLIVDGQRLDPVVRDLTARFHVPADARDVWLVSPTVQPRYTLGGPDTRDLGLYIGALRIDDGFEMRDVAIDDPLLCIGFHEVEDGSRRWTSGRARLPAALWEGCESGFYLRVELAGMPVPRWMAPGSEIEIIERPKLAIVA